MVAWPCPICSSGSCRSDLILYTMVKCCRGEPCCMGKGGVPIHPPTQVWPAIPDESMRARPYPRKKFGKWGSVCYSAVHCLVAAGGVTQVNCKMSGLNAKRPTAERHFLARRICWAWWHWRRGMWVSGRDQQVILAHGPKDIVGGISQCSRQQPRWANLLARGWSWWQAISTTFNRCPSGLCALVVQGQGPQTPVRVPPLSACHSPALAGVGEGQWRLTRWG